MNNFSEFWSQSNAAGAQMSAEEVRGGFPIDRSAPHFCPLNAGYASRYDG